MSPKTTHTPGPFTFQRAEKSDDLTKPYGFILSQSRQVIAEIVEDGNASANGPLLASTPELLAALQHAAILTDDANFAEACALLPELEAVMQQIKSALARATA
jgi:hypothetical protein